jgi:MarR family transcriptional regulator for hemolysin
LQLWIEDGQTQSVLHKKIGIEQPTAVRTLDRMERDQFIKRERSENDRRAIKISLTKKSIILKDKMFDIATEMNDLALDGLTAAERKMFNKFLRITIDNIENQLAN